MPTLVGALRQAFWEQSYSPVRGAGAAQLFH